MTMARASTRVYLPLMLSQLTAGLASGAQGLTAPAPSASLSYDIQAIQASKLPTCPTPFAANPSNTADIAPLWNISDWSTDYTVPDGGSIIFRLVSTLTGYDALCFRRGLYPEGYCMQAVTDGNAGGGGGEPVEGEDTTGTIFQYYDKIGLLQVYQEWDCAGGDGSTAKRVQADGNITVIATDLCKAGDVMKQGEMCGVQGGSGKVFPTLIQVN